jgi:hypothetical protein
MQLFSQWRQEIEAALEASREELEAKLAERDAATLAVRGDRSDKEMVAKAFARIPPRQIAGALLSRRHGWEQGLGESAGTLLRINNAIAALRFKFADLEVGLTQLDQLSPQADEASDDEAA